MHEPSVAKVGPLLAAATAMDRTQLADDAYDFGARVRAFSRIAEEHAATMGQQELLPLLYAAVHSARMDEASLRLSATEAVAAVLRRVANAPERAAEYAALVGRVALPAVRKGLRAASMHVRRSHVGLLEQMVQLFPDAADLVVLRCPDDEEADFFRNIQHIQMHRRIRALTAARKAAEDGTLGTESMLQLLHPLIAHALFEDAGDGTHNLMAAAIEFVGAMCGRLAWAQYFQVLCRYLHLLKTRRRDERALIKVIVAITGAFSFAKPIEAAEQDALPDVEVADEIVAALTSRVLPPLKGLLTVRKEADESKGASDATVSVRPPVALAMASLLVKLPAETRDRWLPQLISQLAWVLRDRLQSSRDSARAVLGDMARLLGPGHLLAMVRALKGGLTRGYQLHVLGFTAHHILNALEGACPPGSLDEVVDELVPVFIDDIFGTTAEEKEAEGAVSNVMEGRRRVSYDSFALLCAAVSPAAIEQVFAPLRDGMSTSESPRVVNKFQDILRNVSTGLIRNSGFSATATAKLAVQLVTENLALSKQGRTVPGVHSRRPSSVYVQCNVPRTKTPEACFNTNAHLMVELGLWLLNAQLKRSRGGGQAVAKDEDEEGEAATEGGVLAALLDPFLPTLSDCLHSQYNTVLDLGLRTFGQLLQGHAALPSLPSVADHVSKRLFKLMRRTGSSQSALELNQACFRVAAILVRDCPWHAITDNEARVLLSYVLADLTTSGKQNLAFGVLKSIVVRKIMVPEVYDAVDRVAEIMVQAHAGSIRSLARHVLLPFLLDYPLGQKRLARTLNFLVANLDYEHDTGASAATSHALPTVPHPPASLGRARVGARDAALAAAEIPGERAGRVRRAPVCGAGQAADQRLGSWGAPSHRRGAQAARPAGGVPDAGPHARHDGAVAAATRAGAATGRGAVVGAAVRSARTGGGALRRHDGAAHFRGGVRHGRRLDHDWG